MIAVSFRPGPRPNGFTPGWVVCFQYVAEIVEIVKSVPPQHRAYNPDKREWWVSGFAAPRLVDELNRCGFVNVIGYVSGQDRSSGYRRPPPRETNPSQSDWAGSLFAAVGPARQDAVFRALTKILHPDNPTTGDAELMKALLAARDPR